MTKMTAPPLVLAVFIFLVVYGLPPSSVDAQTVRRADFIRDLIDSLEWLHQAAVRFEPLEGKKEINLIDLVSVASDSTSDMEKAGGLMAPYLQSSNGEERAAALKMHEAIRLLEQRCDEAVQLAEERVKVGLAITMDDMESEGASSDADQRSAHLDQVEEAWSKNFTKAWERLPDAVAAAAVPVLTEKHADGSESTLSLSASERDALLDALSFAFPDVTDHPKKISWTGAQWAVYAIRYILTTIPPRN